MTFYTQIQKPLIHMVLLFAAAHVHAQAETFDPQSPHNFRQYLSNVLTKHPTVLTAKNQIESAQQDVKGAKWQFLPTPSIGAEKSSRAEDKVTDRRTSFARLQQPLWTGGRLTAQLDKAQALELIAGFALEEQRLTLATRWLQLWAEAQAAELKVLAYTESQEQHRKYFREVKNRAEGGMSPRSDTQLSLTRLAAVEAELEQARAQKRQAISKLEQMYGTKLPIQAINWSTILASTLATDPHQKNSMNEWIAQAHATHPSLQKAVATLNVTRADIELNKAKAYPELYVRAEVLNGDVTKNNRQIYFGMTSSFGAGLSTLSSIDAAEAKLKAQEYEIETRRREIAEQVETDVQNLESQTQRLIYLKKAVEAAGEFLEASERQYSAGRKSWQELMNSAREKAQTLAQLADTKSQHWLSQQRLHLLSMGVNAYLNDNLAPSTR